MGKCSIGGCAKHAWYFYYVGSGGYDVEYVFLGKIHTIIHHGWFCWLLRLAKKVSRRSFCGIRLIATICTKTRAKRKVNRDTFSIKIDDLVHIKVQWCNCSSCLDKPVWAPREVKTEEHVMVSMFDRWTMLERRFTLPFASITLQSTIIPQTCSVGLLNLVSRRSRGPRPHMKHVLVTSAVIIPSRRSILLRFSWNIGCDFWIRVLGAVGSPFIMGAGVAALETTKHSTIHQKVPWIPMV